MTAAVTADGIAQKLKKGLEATKVEVVDVSGGCGAMFEAVVVSPKFSGITRLNQHKLVNATIKDELTQIHAFRVKTYTPDVWEKQQAKSRDEVKEVSKDD